MAAKLTVLENDISTFNPVEFDGFKKEAGLNSFTLTAKQMRILSNSAAQQPTITVATTLKDVK